MTEEPQRSDQALSVHEQFLLKKFRKAMAMTSNGDGTPVWKNFFFLLDLIGQGDFYGTVQFKVLGCVVKDLKVMERTFKVDEMYRDIERAQRPRA